ncbi:hypothetical protein [Novosphingobium sp.]|uniref:hypothetical protein n=1 Tax=Novosphingobium sp. TaxID=1874826 RepID=UPI002602FB5A|nr:hypothetical protein [Novosphingobium sp.]
MTEESDPALGRSQRRLLRRIFNGRTEPIVVDGQPFLTFKAASRFLLALTPDAREQAFVQMRSAAVRLSGGADA